MAKSNFLDSSKPLFSKPISMGASMMKDDDHSGASQFFGYLFSVRDQAHLAHLRVSGLGAFAAHSALGDFYDGILDALKFVDKTSSIGTEIIVDDYDYFSSGAKLAVEHFLDAATLGKWKCEVADRVYGHFATLIREK